MTVTIPAPLLATLRAEAAASPHAEICGLLFGTGTRIAEARATANRAADPARAFEIDPAALIAALKAERGGGPTLLGHYHSHPTGDPVPSPRDAAAAAPDGRLWLILGGGAARLWRAVADGPVEGRFVAVALMVADM